MPKKKIDSRLHDLFAAFENRDTKAEPSADQERKNLEVVRNILLEIESPVPPAVTESSAAPDMEPPAPERVSQPVAPLQAILYEKEQVGYEFSGNSLEPLRDFALKNIDRTKLVLKPLIETGRPVGTMAVEREPSQPWSDEEQNLLDAVAQQVSLQIQNLHLLSSAERARFEAQSATRRFIHESWDTYLDGIRQNERLGYAYDQNTVELFLEKQPEGINFSVPVSVLDEQIGGMFLKTDQSKLTEEDQTLVNAVARQVGQQVESIRLLAEAARARAEAEEATRRLTREGWKEYTQHMDAPSNGYVYDQNQVTSLSILPDNINYTQPLLVQGEVIGELAVAGLDELTPDAAGLMVEIAAQTSVHLETLRLNEELRKRADELQELDRLKSSFLANMSHELRTPLNSILGFSDVILEGIDGPLTDYMENDLKLIQKNGLHLLHLINDVLDMAKIESGRMNLHPEKVNVHDVFTEVISITSSLAGEKKLEVSIAPDSNPAAEIVADVTRIRQVMINLVNNSIKFTEKGSVMLRTMELSGDEIQISIKDTGIGIPPDHLEAIFQEFSQVDTSTTRKVGGTGLGLPISRRLIEMHGGRMWAESQNIPGEGSTFIVVLPRVAILSEPVEIVEKKNA